MSIRPWPVVPVERENFVNPPREYGILPFWFLNGELDPEEMRFQLREFRDKGMPGIILHGRYGLEMPYIGEKYLERIRLAVDEAEKIGLKTWIYDEMNWPSGTADKRVLAARPDLAQRYIECLNFSVRGPWFTYLTGADSRYLDFERSTPVAAFAVSSVGEVIDLTPNLSFRDVIPWEAPAGNWRLMYVVEKTADYYIDALNPEATAEFLRLGYDPYARVLDGRMPNHMLGFYTDEPAMHYFLTGGDNPIVPWTKDMFRRFRERNGYNLRPRLPDLFFDISADSARVRYDFFNTLTDFYSEAFYRQIHEWCQAHGVLFTGHLLYEEWLRKLVRVEGNPFKHYLHMDVIGVDHLYPIIGSQDRPDEHVALKVGSSAAHQLGSPRLLCESFGGIFMDATMQRMKWIADWEYVLGVNLLNPHGFHYTLEGPRKRDWPPSQFYQYPWWTYYGEFSKYISRLSHLLSGGKHVAKVAVLWPIHSMFATYHPQSTSAIPQRIERDFNALTDLLLRLHYDFDYLDEDVLAGAELVDGKIHVADEVYELLVLPPLTHIKLSTMDRMETLVAQGGKLLGSIFLPSHGFGLHGMLDIGERMEALFGLDPAITQHHYQSFVGIETVFCDHPDGGRAGFIRSFALNRQLPVMVQQEHNLPAVPEHGAFVIEAHNGETHYFYAPQGSERQDITREVMLERQAVAETVGEALSSLIEPDVLIDNPDVFYLHRVHETQEDLFFLVNSTGETQRAEVGLQGEIQPVLWEPGTGQETPFTPSRVSHGRTYFSIDLPPVGSVFVLSRPAGDFRVLESDVTLTGLTDGVLEGLGIDSEGFVLLEINGEQTRLYSEPDQAPTDIVMTGDMEFIPEGPNALVIKRWLATPETAGQPPELFTRPGLDTSAWQPVTMGAWSYQIAAEPDRDYPIPVWYRASFQAGYIPDNLALIVDGFAGSDHRIYLNGQPVTSPEERSQLDSQMKSVRLAEWAVEGENLLAIRLTLNSSTDGLLDLIKFTGDFSLESSVEGGYTIQPPRQRLHADFWTNQGYPFYSGRAIYRCSFELPKEYLQNRLFLAADLQDDVLEVLINGQSAGTRLWGPYELEVGEYLRAGQNKVELRVANTLVNLLEASPRPSGLRGAPRLVAYRKFAFTLPQTNGGS